MPYVEQLAERLSPRDWSIIFSVNRLRLLTGSQLERLHFHELIGRSRSVKRGQVLRRLVDAGVLVPLERLVGTANRGSAKQRYALDAAGRRLVRLRAGNPLDKARVRRPRIPSDRLTKHTLAVSELYVQLVEAARPGGFKVREFQVEADAYWPDGQGGWVKPDAFVWLERPGLANYWWYEADMPRHESDTATEDEPTIRDKLLNYLDFVERGQLGPDGIVPRPLFGVPTGRRRAAIQSLIEELPAPADALFRVAEMVNAAQVMVEEIMKKKEDFADA
jgi:hypothetical protein